MSKQKSVMTRGAEEEEEEEEGGRGYIAVSAASLRLRGSSSAAAVVRQPKGAAAYLCLAPIFFSMVGWELSLHQDGFKHHG